MPHLKKLRDAAKAWAAQEAADIQSGAKKPPTSSLEKFMADKDKPLKTGLVREVGPKRTRLLEAANKRLQRHSPGALSDDYKTDSRMRAAAETGEAQAFVGKLKPGLEKRTQQHHLQSREFPKTKTGDLEIGTPQKDLNRSVLNTVRKEASTPGSEGTLRKLAQKRQAAGNPVAGRPGNLDGSRNTLSNRLKGIGGKMGGKLGAYGIIKGVVEGASTLRKLKSGAYDLTPEGTAKPKKGVVES